MSELVLVTESNCHLCAHGRTVLDRLVAEGVLSWREVDCDSVEAQGLIAVVPPLRPVLCDSDGHVLAYGRLSARRLRRDLARRDGRLRSPE